MVTKEQVLNRISEIDDESLMQELNAVLDFYENNDEVYIFTKEEEILINESLTQVKEGKVTDHQKVFKLSEQWSKE